MNFILINWVKYYTKETFKTLKVVTIGSAIIVSVAFIKYRPVYKVTLSGETIGYTEKKESIEEKIEKYLDDTTGNIAFKEIEYMPEYEFKLVNRAEKISEKDVVLAIQDKVTTTYKTYGITVDGEQKVIVNSQDEAEKIINELNEDLNKNIDLKLGVVEVFSTELALNSEDEAKSTLGEIKTAKVKEYEDAVAKEKAAKAAAIAKAKAKALAQSQAQVQMQTETSSGEVVATAGVTVASAGSINGMNLSIPVNGKVSSRFGSRSSIRSSSHTGIDISCPQGTGISPVSSGVVTFATYNGSYGNLIKVDHGNGVESWYAHCSAIYVSVGQSVAPGSVIGAVGQTGNTTGPHLHLEIRIGGAPVNPQNYLY